LLLIYINIGALAYSRSIQWAMAGTAILTTLIANESTLTLLMGETWTKAILLVSTMVNGIIVALFRAVTTESLPERRKNV